MITKAEKDRLLAQAEGLVADPDQAQAQFGELVAEFQATTGVNQERARYWVAKAIRRAKYLERKEAPRT